MSGTGASKGAPEAAGPRALLHGSVTGLGKKYSQDSHLAVHTSDGRAVLLAVADGHGSSAHFRSDLGARWAVREFASCAEHFAREAVRRAGHGPDLGSLLAGARRLPQELTHRWRRRALLHDWNSPAHGDRPRDAASAHRPAAGSGRDSELDAYGSTLVGAVVTEQLLVCWQLGDGEVVLVDADGRAHAPLSTGPDLGDETDSLCEYEAWRLMRLHWQPLTGDGPPPDVLLSTDGLSKSFTDDDRFLEFVTGLAERVDEHGPEAVQRQLPDWLAHAASFSGDDTTLVAALRPVRTRRPRGPGVGAPDGRHPPVQPDDGPPDGGHWDDGSRDDAGPGDGPPPRGSAPGHHRPGGPGRGPVPEERWEEGPGASRPDRTLPYGPDAPTDRYGRDDRDGDRVSGRYDPDGRTGRGPGRERGERGEREW